MTRLRALKHQSRQQRHANGVGVLANMRRGFGSNPSAQAFDQLGSIALKQVRRQLDGTQRLQFGDLGIENLGAEPFQQRFFVGATTLADLRHLTDLRPVGFDGSPFPEILGKEGSINPHLSRKKAHHLLGHLLPGTQETAFVLQALK